MTSSGAAPGVEPPAQSGPPSESVWRPARPVDVRRTLSPLMRGGLDPAHRFDVDGTFWWATRTPAGPGTLALRVRGGEVHATAWGPGSGWLHERVPRLLGGDGVEWDDLDVSANRLLHDTQRAHRGLRLPATGLVLDVLVPSILEQRVTGREARRSWRLLLQYHGTPAPGPRTDLRVPPDAAALLRVPTWDWHRFGVELARQRPIRAAATVAARLEECCSMDPDAALARLRILPGVGEWTAAETLQRAVGHPDAVSVGDYHLHDQVVHALTGRARGDDAEMLRLLEPWRGRRQLVVRLVEVSGVGKPRFGPRYTPQDMRRM